jgi:hypothetical protein
MASGITSASDPNTGNLSITFTNPVNTATIQTPDVSVNISGTVAGDKNIDIVKWQNDRGGQGAANGTESWSTGHIALQVGTNNITVTAVDELGKSASETLTVEREPTTPIATDPPSNLAIAMYSYNSDLRDAAPVANASILAQPVYFFIVPSDGWTNDGVLDVRIACCKGVSGPGAGEGYFEEGDATAAPWSQLFDLAGLEPGGERRIRFFAKFQDGTESDPSTADFIVEEISSGSNSTPIITGSPDTNVAAGNRYDFQPFAQDLDGDTMGFSIVNKPSWAKFDAATGHLYGTPTANDASLTYDSIVISVSDGKMSSSLPAFSIIVEAVGTGTASLSWSTPTFRTDNTPLTNLAGFNIYYGKASGDRRNKVTIRDAGANSYVVNNLSSGTWFFVVTAFDELNFESAPSGEGSKTL